MGVNPDDYLRTLESFWNNNQPLDAGRLIFESMQGLDRSRWAKGILRFVVTRLKVEPYPVADVLDLAERSHGWTDAHHVFDVVRDQTLKLEAMVQRTTQQELQLAVLMLAELVAKVLYGATDPPDAFDEDSGWWIVVCLKDIVDQVNDDQLTNDVWRELIRSS
jgi:hypothetical protein